MKTKTYILTLLLAMTAAFACSRIEIDTDETTPVAVENGEHVLVPFSAEAGAAETRVVMDGSTTNMVFSEGDKLMVYSYQLVETSLLTLKSGAGQKSAVFTGDLILASGKTEADLAGKKLYAVLMPEAGIMMGIFSYKSMFGKLTVDYSSGAIDSNLEALVARTALYEGETTYEARNFSFQMLSSYVKMNVTVPSEESDLARDYTVEVTNDWHICAKATCNRSGWEALDYSATVSGTFTASSATKGTLYMAVLADNQVRLLDDSAWYDEVDFSISMNNGYKGYGLTGGSISKAVIPPGKGVTKSITLRDYSNEDVLLGQPESVRSRIMNTYHADKNSNGYLSKYEAAQLKSCKMYGNTDLTDASFYGYFTGMTTFEEETLINCREMTKVILPKYINGIGDSAFEGCVKLLSVYLPSGVTRIGDYAFYNCHSLTRIVVPSGVTSIGDYAFKFCVDMTEVVFDTPVQVSSIGVSAFQGCNSLEAFAVPSKVKTIGEKTFLECTALTAVSIPSGVTSIGDEAFRSCTFLDDVYIPASVTSIGKTAFAECTHMKTIHMPTKLKEIPANLFRGCTALESITIPKPVTSIGDRAFKECSSLKTLIIPAAVTSIGYEAIYHCDELTTIYCYPPTPPSISRYSIYYYPKLTTIYVPDRSAYLAAMDTWGQWFKRMLVEM